MCPVCMTTAVLIVGGVASAGGLLAVAVRKSGVTNAGNNHSTPSRSEECGKPEISAGG